MLDCSLQPELFRPMQASEVAQYLKVSRRTLEAWRQSTKDRGVLHGPPFYQDYDGGKVLYPEIGVKRFAMARAAGRGVQVATQFAWQPLSDLCSALGWSLPDYRPKELRGSHQSLHS